MDNGKLTVPEIGDSLGYSPREVVYNAKNCPPSVGPQCRYIHADGITQCDFKVPDGRGPYCSFHRAAVRLEVFEAKAKAWDRLTEEYARPWKWTAYIPERFLELELRNKE